MHYTRVALDKINLIIRERKAEIVLISQNAVILKADDYELCVVDPFGGVVWGGATKDKTGCTD